MLKLGISSSEFKNDSDYGIDYKKYKKLGYDSLDYGAFFMSNNPVYQLDEKEFILYFKGLKKEVEENGLIIYQMHALWDPEAEKKYHDNLQEFYVKCLKAAGILGCPYVVMHPVSPNGWDTPFTYQEIFDRNIDFISKLVPFCKEYHTKLAIENLPFRGVDNFFNPINTLKLINTLNSEEIVMCVDTGHFNIFRDCPIYDTIVKIGDKLKVLHIHDNMGDADYHLLPKKGNFNWDDFCLGLKEIKFDGVLNLETGISKDLPREEFDKASEELVNILKDFREKIEC